MVDIRKVKNRGRVLISLLSITAVVFAARAFQVQIVQHGKFAAYADSQQKSAIVLKARRGVIFDSQGKALAYDLEAKTYTVNPRYIKDKSAAAAKLARLTGKSAHYWRREFQKHPGYLVVAPKVPQNRELEFEKSGVETIRARIETIRVYPYDRLGIEVIGRTDPENNGVSGLESQYDKVLSGIDGRSVYLRDARGNEITSWEQTIVEPHDGNDVYLTLDIDFQQIVSDELSAMLELSEAKWGTAVFLDVASGGVLACATVEKGRPEFPRCRGIVDMNEPGSTAKIMPLVTVFQSGIFEPDDIINVEGGRFNIGRRVIRDDHPHDSLRCDEIGIYSSNIGVSKMGMAAGKELVYRTLVQFGFGVRTGIDFPGESAGMISDPSEWNNHLLANICFGYGITATAVQMAAAYGVIAGGGDLKRPYFASRMTAPDGTQTILNSPRTVRRVLDRDTIEILDKILREVVVMGTARKADDDYHLVSGKTGTALRTYNDRKGYDSSRSLASFAGYFPAANPRIVGIIMFDEPKNSIYGGEVAAPVFKKVAIRYCSLPRNYEMLDPPFIRFESAELVVSSAGKEAALTDAFEPTEKDDGIVPYDHSVLPDFVGITMREAMNGAKALGLSYSVTGSGVVSSQSPSPGVPIGKVESLELVGGLK